MYKDKTESLTADDYQKTPVTASSQFHQGLQKAKAKEFNGIVFPSKLERDRYDELFLKQLGGLISDLKPHQLFKLRINGVNVGRYKSDSTYMENGVYVVEEVKRPFIYGAEKFRLRVIKACLEMDEACEFRVWSDGRYVDFK